MFKSNMWRYFQEIKNNLHIRFKWTNSSSCDDVLEDIDDEELPKLRDMLRKDWPKYLDIYITVDNFIKWKNLNPKTKVKIMCPDGHWDDGTFVIVASEGLHTIVLFTMDQSCERLMSALKETKRINWSTGSLVYPFHEKFSNALLPVLTNIGQPVQKNGKYYLWYIPKEVALNFDITCPEDCYLAPLEPKHATEINNSWDYASPESRQYVYNNIKMNYGVGLFSRSSTELLASALITDVGCIGLVRTSANHRNKGYGKLIIQAISKQRARDTEPIMYTAQENTVMNSVVQSLGFICLHECRLVQFETTDAKL